MRPHQFLSKLRQSLQWRKIYQVFLILFSLLICTPVLADVDEKNTPKVISGRIVNGNGEGIPGVNIIVKGTMNGTISDESGAYSISIKDINSMLVFKFIGFLSQEIAVENQETINVKLIEDIKGLEQVVVIGYGTKSKKEITGAMSSIDSKEIAKLIVTGVDQAMTGKAAGVQIVQNSATPGGGSSIRIRGVGTPGVNEPLFVVDGVPIFPDDNKRVAGGGSGNVLNSINPSDIESIDILKDAASAAIYGARAANGVILITTKQGQVGAPKVGIDYNYGVQQFEQRLDLMNAAEYKEFRTALRKKFVDSTYDTDWLSEITRLAKMNSVNFNVSGGNINSTYYSSFGYTNQEGIVKGTDYERFTGRLNTKSNINKHLRVGSNLSFAFSKQNRQPEQDIYSSVVGAALLQPPIVPVREPSGEYGSMGEYVKGGGFERVNPVAIIENGYNRVTNFKALGNLNLEYEPVKNLIYKLSAGLDYENTSTDNYKPEILVGINQKKVSDARIDKYLANEMIWLLENTLRYNFSIASSHNFSLLVGATQQASRFETLGGSSLGEVSKDPNLTSINSSPSTIKTVSGYFSEWAIASFLGRFDYNYDNRYLLSATVRRDGSSKFMKGKQWGTFPSISAGWNIDDEHFFHLAFVSDLKLRASWGKLGNQEVAPFQYLSTLANTEYVLNNMAVVGVYPNKVANENITWETSVQKDVGIDAAFFDNKITITVDLFEKVTEGILLQNVISSVYGYTNNLGESLNPISNSGVVSNKGAEFSLGFRNYDKEFKWGVNANVATLKNEVLSLGGGDPIYNTMNKGLYSTKTDVGTQVGAFYGQKVIGVNEDGYFDFETVEIDGKQEKLQTNIGNPIPSLTFGLNINASYKGFDFYLSAYGVAGNDIYAATLYQIGNFSYSINNQLKAIVDQAGITAPKMNAAGGPDYAASDWFVYDGSFARLKSVQFGYTFSKQNLEKIGLGQLRIYISGQNLLTIDNYNVGLNPEVGAFNQNNVAAGIDEGTYPVAQSVSLGLMLNF
jgi:TonB-linked SusC/RagA family outer membrane protein